METGKPAWSSDEHDRFLEALEKFGSGNTGEEWQLMAKHVGTRTHNEIKLHAHKYFLRLQLAPSAASGRGASSSAGGADSSVASVLDPAIDPSDSAWTLREDGVFEDALAQYGEGTDGRWDRIAALIPGKTAAAVQRRFQKLLCDVARLSTGHEIELVYKPESAADALVVGDVTADRKRPLEATSTTSPSGAMRSKRRT